MPVRNWTCWTCEGGKPCAPRGARAGERRRRRAEAESEGLDRRRGATQPQRREHAAAGAPCQRGGGGGPGEPPLLPPPTPPVASFISIDENVLSPIPASAWRLALELSLGT